MQSNTNTFLHRFNIATNKDYQFFLYSIVIILRQRGTQLGTHPSVLLSVIALGPNSFYDV